MAREHHRYLLDVARDPYTLTYWTFRIIVDRKRIETLVDRIATVNKATLNALAFNDPNKLSLERDAAREAARRARQSAPEEAQATAEREARLARLLAAVDNGGLLEDR